MTDLLQREKSIIEILLKMALNTINPSIIDHGFFFFFSLDNIHLYIDIITKLHDSTYTQIRANENTTLVNRKETE